MPKLKTHRGAAKRLRRNGAGALRRKRAGKRHLLTHKSRDRKRRLKGSAGVGSAAVRQAERLMPYK